MLELGPPKMKKLWNNKKLAFCRWETFFFTTLGKLVLLFTILEILLSNSYKYKFVFSLKYVFDVLHAKFHV